MSASNHNTNPDRSARAGKEHQVSCHCNGVKVTRSSTNALVEENKEHLSEGALDPGDYRIFADRIIGTMLPRGKPKSTRNSRLPNTFAPITSDHLSFLNGLSHHRPDFGTYTSKPRGAATRDERVATASPARPPSRRSCSDHTHLLGARASRNRSRCTVSTF